MSEKVSVFFFNKPSKSELKRIRKELKKLGLSFKGKVIYCG